MRPRAHAPARTCARAHAHAHSVPPTHMHRARACRAPCAFGSGAKPAPLVQHATGTCRPTHCSPATPCTRGPRRRCRGVGCAADTSRAARLQAVCTVGRDRAQTAVPRHRNEATPPTHPGHHHAHAHAHTFARRPSCAMPPPQRSERTHVVVNMRCTLAVVCALGGCLSSAAPAGAATAAPKRRLAWHAQDRCTVHGVSVPGVCCMPGACVRCTIVAQVSAGAATALHPADGRRGDPSGHRPPQPSTPRRCRVHRAPLRREAPLADRWGGERNHLHSPCSCARGGSSGSSIVAACQNDR
jgi:hypothetical protein